MTLNEGWIGGLTMGRFSLSFLFFLFLSFLFFFFLSFFFFFLGWSIEERKLLKDGYCEATTSMSVLCGFPFEAVVGVCFVLLSNHNGVNLHQFHFLCVLLNVFLSAGFFFLKILFWQGLVLWWSFWANGLPKVQMVLAPSSFSFTTSRGLQRITLLPNINDISSGY